MEEMIFPQPAFYLFKCETQNPPMMPKPSCVNEQTKGLFNYMATKLMEKGINTTAIAVRTTCQSRCKFGPVMLIEPGHHMYVQLNEEKIDRIINEHILEGNPVKEYIIPDELWGEPISPKDAQRLNGF